MNSLERILPAATLTVFASLSLPLRAAPSEGLYVEDVAFALESLEKECGSASRTAGESRESA